MVSASLRADKRLGWMVWLAYANARVLVVTKEQAKEAEKLEPKGTVAGRRSDFASLVDKKRHRQRERT